MKNIVLHIQPTESRMRSRPNVVSDEAKHKLVSISLPHLPLHSVAQTFIHVNLLDKDAALPES